MKNILILSITFLVSLANCFAQANEKLTISIIRTSHNSESITGELFVNGKFLCHTLELPWMNNESFVSSIPTGTYKSHLRYDKKDAWRIELDDVPKRTNVQIHIGNYPKEILGCVLIGETVFNAENRLEGSSEAYKKFKSAFYGSDDPNKSPNVDILVTINYFPLATKYIASSHLWTFDYEGKGAWNWKIKSEYNEDEEMNKKYTEIKRDLEYIYFDLKSAQEPESKLRIPIKGGKGGMYMFLRDKWQWWNTVDFKREN